MKLKSFCTILLLINSLSINAEVTLDGTLGRGGALKGPDYLIGADLGRQHGGNLFHSFQYFNLNRSESATFSGHNSVSNIISRVTGGNPSQIDGLIRSTIPNADMYFLNPYGIMFGPNAKLDVQGSFHASTADYLRLGDGGRFDVRNPSNSLLTVAPVANFGFLSNTPASIKLQESHLSVPEGISLIGGDIDINASKLELPTERELFFNSLFEPQIYPPQLFSLKQINLISVAEHGSVALDTFNIRGGQITINKSHVGVINNGEIFIRAGELKLVDSLIGSMSFEESGLIDISVDNLELQGDEFFAGIHSNTLGIGKGSTINLQMNDFTINKGGVYNVTFGTGEGGDTFITVSDNLTIVGQYIPELDIPSGILGFTFTEENAGNVGDINIQAGQMILDKGAQIFNRTLSAGDSGAINISVDGAITMTGEDKERDGLVSGIFGQSGNEEVANSGDAARIRIKAQQITLADGAGIASETFGFGNGGDISIQLTESLTIYGQGSYGFPSKLSASSIHNGHAGNVDITAKQITLTAGGFISSATLGSGNAGSIDIQADQIQVLGGFDKPWDANFIYDEIRFLPSGIFTSSAAKMADIGDAGAIKIEARQITLLDGGQINSETDGGGEGSTIKVTATDTIIADGKYIGEQSLWKSGIISLSDNQESYAGNAGNIVVQADSILLSNEGAISTEARNASGGNININTSNLLYLRENGSIITSVNGGDGNGGNINIGNSQFVVLDNAHIKAQAYAGRGGNINIGSERFIRTPDSLVSASSKLGIDGDVKIDSPDTDMERFFVVLPGGFVESNQLQSPCASLIAENQNRFVIVDSEGTSNAVNDLLPSGPPLSQIKPIKTTNSMTGKGTMAKPAVKVALLAGCQPDLLEPPARIRKTATRKRWAVKRSRVIPEEPLF